MADSKHEALQEWVSEFLENNYLYYQSANAEPGIRMIVPEFGDYVNKTDILGYKYKSYVFIFIAYEQIDTGTSDVNIWYAYDNDTKTLVSKQTISYDELLNVSKKIESDLTDDSEIIVTVDEKGISHISSPSLVTPDYIYNIVTVDCLFLY